MTASTPAVVIAAGGTAGHVVPALAVADALSEIGARVSFVGTRDRAEASLVPERGYPIDFLDVRGLDRRNPLRASLAALKAVGAVGAASRVLVERGADAVMGGGGYVAGPVGVAAKRCGLPLVLTEADSHLGITNRLLARWADRVCLGIPIAGREGDPYLVTGRPVPPSIGAADRDAARRRYGIEPDSPCLLLFGGSLGALTINLAAAGAYGGAHADVDDRDYHVLHISGERDYERIRELVGTPAAYTLMAYEPDLAAALAAADLVVARSGGSVFEIAAAGKPAILVPYPHATARHQHANAAWMVEAGAARMIEDSELGSDRLRDEVEPLLADADRLIEMAAASSRISRPDAAERIAAEILSTL